MTTLALRIRTRSWLTRWSPMLPLLLAEATVWMGFGALLPILPIYFTQHGTDLRLLGVVIAAWPAARLVTEPLFGWIADRVPRKPLMVVGLFMCAIATVLPLAIVGPVAFLVLRALAGLASSIYDPAARGYLVDANPPEQQGETFGLYGAAQMGGLMLGPAVGGIAVALTRDPTVGFWVAGVALLVAGVLVAFRIHEPSQDQRAVNARERAAAVEEQAQRSGAIPPPTSLANKFLAAAVVMNLAWFFTSGAYEVVWSLYITSIGGTIELVGLTFAAFAFPVLILGPIAGRFIDQRGGLRGVAGGHGRRDRLRADLPGHPRGVVRGAPGAGGGRGLRPGLAGVVRAGRARLTTRPELDGPGHLRRSGHDRHDHRVGVGGSARGDRPSLPVLRRRHRRPGGTRPGPPHRGPRPAHDPRADHAPEASAPRIPAVRLTTTRSASRQTARGKALLFPSLRNRNSLRRASGG